MRCSARAQPAQTVQKICWKHKQHQILFSIKATLAAAKKHYTMGNSSSSSSDGGTTSATNNTEQRSSRPSLSSRGLSHRITGGGSNNNVEHHRSTGFSLPNVSLPSPFRTGGSLGLSRAELDARCQPSGWVLCIVLVCMMYIVTHMICTFFTGPIRSK